MATNSTDKTIWRRVETYEEFCKLFTDREFINDELKFIIQRNGTMTGSLGESVLTGTWKWEDGYFCRHSYLDDEDLGTDCELIETDGHRMKYVRNKGLGESEVVC